MLPMKRIVPAVLAAFLLTITSCSGYYGYQYWRMNQRIEAMHAREALKPKPVEIPIEVVDCVRGTPEPGKYGYVDVLDVRILVPCDVTAMTRPLTDGRFGLSWAGNITLSNGRIVRIRNIFENRTIDSSPHIERIPYQPSADLRTVTVPMLSASGTFQKQDVFMTCNRNLDPRPSSHCRFSFLTSEKTSVFVEAFQNGVELSDQELSEIVSKIASAVQPASGEK